MILTKEEKQRIVESLSWMITDMKYKSDESRGNLFAGSEGGYSPELTKAIEMFEWIQGIETTEVSGCHRKAVSVNCREFKCALNKSGTCSAPKVTFQSGGLIVGRLICIEAEEKKDE